LQFFPAYHAHITRPFPGRKPGSKGRRRNPYTLIGSLVMSQVADDRLICLPVQNLSPAASHG
jgi:hypothetical protein